MFNIRSKSYSEDFNSMNNTVFMWVHREFLMNNIEKYIRVVLGYNVGENGEQSR